MIRTQVDEIKEKLNILDIARSYIVNIKKSGSNYFALCPFHNEKTPSFSINPELGIFKCFGCGVSGDVISLIEKLENVDFIEALEIASKKAGIVLIKKYSPKDQKLFKQKEELLKLNSLVSEYYSYILQKHKNGEKGREYLKKRNISLEFAKKFNIGYAPKSYKNLINFLLSKKYKTENLIQYGLLVSMNGRVYDKFRSRVIFPLIDSRNDTIGFSGRTVLKDTKAPKYLHSPQTITFNKSKFLFGLYHAKESIRKFNFIIFCEGQIDVISSHKTKYKNIVASLGTSLSEEQLKIAYRYTENIYFCFDNDIAGENALIRSSYLAHNQNFNVKAISISQGKDIDELININKKEWENCVNNAEPIVDHMIRRLYKRLDVSILEGKEEFTKVILPLIASLPSKIEQAHYIHRISLIINVSEDILKEELNNQSKSKDFIPHIDTNKIKIFLKNPVNTIEEYLFALILQHPNFLNLSLKLTKTRYFTLPSLKEILKKLKEYNTNRKKFILKDFTSSLIDHEVKYIQNLLLFDLKNYFDIESEYKNELENIVNYLKKSSIRNEIKKIKIKIEKAEHSKDKKETKLLLNKLMNLVSRIGKI